MPTIELSNVTKYFGDVCAVRNVSFKVDREEIVGFVGPNGAGKSTCLKMLATYLAPSEGRVFVDGFDTVADSLEVRKRIGYLSGDTPLYEQMRVERFIRFVAEARGLSGSRLRSQFDWTVGVCGIDSVLEKRVNQCSTGFRQRVGLATAMIHDPPVLILDEPTHGFDPLQVVAFRDTLSELRAGRAIVFSSHIIQEVSALSDRIIIINEGDLLGDGTPEDLVAQTGKTATVMEEVFAALVEKHKISRGARG